MSKGQMEIFGLVIIVILVSLGLLFAIMIISRAPNQQTSQIKDSIQAANFLNTVMGTTTENCNGRTVRELVQDCAVAGVDNGEWIGASVCENGKNTCEYSEETIGLLLRDTLGKWGKSYSFSMTGTQSVELIKISQGSCDGEREGSSRPEKVKPGLDVILTLHICLS